MLSIIPECSELDQQMDQIDAALTQLETKRDALHEEATQLLVDLRRMREGNREKNEEEVGERERHTSS